MARGAPACTAPSSQSLLWLIQQVEDILHTRRHPHVPLPDPAGVPQGLYLPRRTLPLWPQSPHHNAQANLPLSCCSPRVLCAHGRCPRGQSLGHGKTRAGRAAPYGAAGFGPSSGLCHTGRATSEDACQGGQDPHAQTATRRGSHGEGRVFLVFSLQGASEQQDGRSAASLLIRWTGPRGGQNGCSCPRG